jgi:hypothetical protein
MTGRVFAKPLTLGEYVLPWISEEVLQDVDMQGRNLHVFARDWFAEALAVGVSHCLVEAPEVGQATTLADQRAARLRPYLVQVHPRRVLGWKHDGRMLTQLRVAFTRTEDSSPWETREVEQVRVYEPGLVTVWEKDGDGDWQPIQEFATGLPMIPLATVYTGRTGVLTATPPLRELAFLNVKHWQQQSGADTLLDTASVPLLTLIGADTDQQIVIGGKYAVRLPRDADMKFVEHSGAAIGAGRDALEALKDEMRQAGAKLLAPQGASAKTATQASEEAARENSALGAMAQNLEDTLDHLLDLLAMYRGADYGGSIKVNANLDPELGNGESMVTLLNMRNAGALSDATLFGEAQRRGMVRDDIAWEDEQARIGGAVE